MAMSRSAIFVVVRVSTNYRLKSEEPARQPARKTAGRQENEGEGFKSLNTHLLHSKISPKVREGEKSPTPTSSQKKASEGKGKANTAATAAAVDRSLETSTHTHICTLIQRKFDSSRFD